jgi:hypothetical protein
MTVAAGYRAPRCMCPFTKPDYAAATAQKVKFRSPRRFNVLAHEDMHRASYQRSLTSFRRVRFASVVDVGRPIIEETPATTTSLWHSDEDYAAFMADIRNIVARYRRGCRTDDLHGLEWCLRCPPIHEHDYHHRLEHSV